MQRRLVGDERGQFFVELANGGAMGAADVVGEDFQLRLGVNDGVLGQQQRLVGLLGIGLLGILADEDLAVEDAVSAIAEDALVNLMARTVRLGVIDDGEVIDVLLAAGLTTDQGQRVEHGWLRGIARPGRSPGSMMLNG